MGKLGSSSILLRQHKVNIACPILSDHLTLMETANAYLKDKIGYRLGVVQIKNGANILKAN